MVTIQMENKLRAKGAKIVVVGCGGGGGNAVNSMIATGLDGVTFVAANTDIQALEGSRADQRLQIGPKLTGGLGAGGDPEIGRDAAQEDPGLIADVTKDADMVFVTAGMGGGTGTGSAPVVAKIARESKALTVGVVTKPFRFEGAARKRNAEAGIKELAKHVDSLIVIPNDNLRMLKLEKCPLTTAFSRADNVLYEAVKAISDIIVVPGLINVDFADARRIMSNRGKAIMGMGEGAGEGRAMQAAQAAMTSSLLEESDISGATGVLVNITGGEDLDLFEVDEAMNLISQAADDEAEVIFGCVIDPNMGDRVKITLIATGFEHAREFDRVQLETSNNTADNDNTRRLIQEHRTGILKSSQNNVAQQPSNSRGYPVVNQPKTQTNMQAVTPQRVQEARHPSGFHVAAPTVSTEAVRVQGPRPEVDRNRPDNWF